MYGSHDGFISKNHIVILDRMGRMIGLICIERCIIYKKVANIPVGERNGVTKPPIGQDMNVQPREVKLLLCITM